MTLQCSVMCVVVLGSESRLEFFYSDVKIYTFMSPICSDPVTYFINTTRDLHQLEPFFRRQGKGANSWANLNILLDRPQIIPRPTTSVPIKT